MDGQILHWLYSLAIKSNISLFNISVTLSRLGNDVHVMQEFCNKFKNER